MNVSNYMINQDTSHPGAMDILIRKKQCKSQYQDKKGDSYVREKETDQQRRSSCS